MKKRIPVILFTVIMVIACALCVVACVDDEKGDNASEVNVNGVYYIWDGGEQLEGNLTFKDGKFTMLSQERLEIRKIEGTYTVDGNDIKLSSGGATMTMVIVSDGILRVDTPSGESQYYCEDGKTPPMLSDKQ